jgi:hypothetical protein
MRIAGVLCLALPTEETGDGGEPPLFDESGVWAVELYSLDGGPYVEIPANRADRFLLRFKPSDGVLAAAACTEQGTAVDIDSSNCTNAALASWSCECFAYTFEGDHMAWQSFTPVPGELPPAVGDGAHELTVAPALGVSDVYDFMSLPVGLFGSDGAVAKHAFTRRAEQVWTDVDANVDTVPDLEACSRSCFPSEAGG